ncbi:MFS transporter [Nakamurella sp. YIM 132087]|uniref:MFS transporter n=1 Tax=Nakamurella alba TaxID=2665158 RepID=A0A7K1FQ86_9ACTN|nr:MFS transporter [Nakamurella alba]MTD16307.1 MFS transporter [Nakamurella alba]
MSAVVQQAVTGAGAAVRRRMWWRVWGAVVVSSWGGNQFSPLLVMYEDREHYSTVATTLFLGLYVIGLAPALLVAGSLSDRHGRRPLLIAGVAAGVIGSALLALGELGPEFLALGRLFSGFTVGAAVAVGTSWIKELSDPEWDPSARPGAGARRASLAFLLGSAGGACVAGVLAQFAPLPEVLPYVVHCLVAAPFLVVLLRTPETHRSGGVPGPWWRQLRVPSAGHRRFRRVVLLVGPWIFVAYALGYGYLPTQLREATGSGALLFATLASGVALGASSAVQPIAKRLHTERSARALTAGLLALTVGMALVPPAIALQSLAVGVVANVIIGAGAGICLVSALQEVQRIATTADLAGLTGRFYAVAYAGFLAPSVISAVALLVPVQLVLWIVVGVAAASLVLLQLTSRRHPVG